MEALVSIIIVNWNACEMLKGCLNSIKENTSHKEYEIIVVDNASTDGSPELVKRKFPAVKLVESKENLGFAEANNKGFGIAEGEYIYLLNNDCLVVKGWLENALKAMESDERIAAAGSKLVAPTDERIIADKSALVKEKLAVCGAAMLLRKSALDAIGGFDSENFGPFYGEEQDWCYRAINAGYRIMQADSSIVMHYGSASTKKRFGFEEQYYRMHLHGFRAIFFNLSFGNALKHFLGIGLVFVNSFKLGTTHLFLKAFWENLKDWEKISAERKKRKQKAIELKKRLWK